VPGMCLPICKMHESWERVVSNVLDPLYLHKSGYLFPWVTSSSSYAEVVLMPESPHVCFMAKPLCVNTGLGLTLFAFSSLIGSVALFRLYT